MSLIGILLFGAFIILLIKAIFETLQFLFIALQVGILYLLAMMLNATAAVIRFCGMTPEEKAPQPQSRPRPKSQPAMAGAMSFGSRPDRQLVAH